MLGEVVDFHSSELKVDAKGKGEDLKGASAYFPL